MQIFQWRFIHPRFWLSWLGLLLMWITVFIPARLQIFIGKLIGIISSPILKKKKRVALRNLELCFPEMPLSEREKLVEENMQRTSTMLLETASSWWASDKQLAKRVTYEGLEHLEQAKASGKGIILLTGHFTSMEMGGRLIMMKTPAYVMFRRLNNELFNAAMMKARTFHSEGIVLRNDPRAMIRALRKNKVVWYAPDQDFGERSSIFAKFFGITAATVPATGKMAQMGKAIVLPFVPRRESNGHYTITIQKPLENYPTGDEIVDAQAINDWVEQEVRKSPEQYLWVHRRFKTQPDGKHALYGGKQTR